MKKNRYFLCDRYCFHLHLWEILKLNYNGVKLKDFPANSILKTSINLTSEQELGNIVILPNEIFNQQEAAQIISRLDKLPPSLSS